MSLYSTVLTVFVVLHTYALYDVTRERKPHTYFFLIIIYVATRMIPDTGVSFTREGC